MSSVPPPSGPLAPAVHAQAVRVYLAALQATGDRAAAAQAVRDQVAGIQGYQIGGVARTAERAQRQALAVENLAAGERLRDVLGARYTAASVIPILYHVEYRAGGGADRHVNLQVDAGIDWDDAQIQVALSALLDAAVGHYGTISDVHAEVIGGVL